MSQESVPYPPHAAVDFLRWFCPSYLVEDVEGDLHELFLTRLAKLGRFRANLWYWWNTLWFLRPYVLTGQTFTTIGPAMWKNYAKVAVRQMRRRPLYSGINIAGLALGIASCIIMLLYVQDELAFDGFHENADRLYRVVEKRTSDEGEVLFAANTAGTVGPALVADMPEVEASIRMFDASLAGRSTMRHDQNERHEGEYIVAGPSFLEAMDFPLIAGDRATALDLPLSLILTESAAEFYLGRTDVMGEIVTGSEGDYTVTGVMPDLPSNSHLQFVMVKSWATFESNPRFKQFMDDWQSAGFMTYLLLEPSARPEAVSERLESFSATYREAEAWNARAYTIQALPAIHFDSAYIDTEHNVGESTRTFIYIFMLIALLIAMIACINYMNLSTARAMQRAREVGLRKVVGAKRGQLIGQFLGESLIMAMFALVVATVLVLAVLPAFNAFVGKSLSLNPSGAGMLLLGVLATTLVVGLLSGSYPAFYIARFNPSHVFAKLGGGGREGRLLRNGLVVLQFALSIVLIASTIVSARQFAYVQNKDLGFDESRLLVLDINSGASRNSFASMKQEYRQLAAVEAVSVSSRIPGDWKGVPTVAVRVPGGSPDDRLDATFLGVDADFLDTYRMTLAAGRNFSEEFRTDSSAILVNETAARMLGISGDQEHALSILDATLGGQRRDRGYEATVIGIVEDFHFESLHETIRPIILGFRNNPIQSIDYFTLRVATNDVASLLAQVATVQERFDPDTPVESNFLEMRLAERYTEDRRAGTVFNVATGLALLIACFGLFGLAAFVAEQKTKEIGVRKALGASVGGITLKMSAAFTKLVLIAFLIATPVAIWITSKWLDSFAYHVNLGVGTMLSAGGAALLLAWGTVAYQAFRAAQADPVTALRND